MKKGQKVLGAILLTAAVLGLAGILFLTFGAVKDLSVSYHAMQEADLTEEYTGTLIYDDHLYAMIGNGIEIDETVTDRAGMMGAFLEDALRTIDMRILSAGIIYAMMISAVAAYPLMCRYGEKRGAHVGAACCSVVVCYFIYLASVLILCRAFGVPFRLPALSGLLRLAAGLLCTMGGSCALAVLISSVRFGAVAAVLAVPLVFALFLFSMLFEAQLYSEPTIDSFAYLSEINEHAFDEDFEGEIYYDEEKNVVVLEGKEYPPEQLENPDRLTGAGRWGGFLYEVLDPYSGNSLYLAEQALGSRIGIHVYGLYALKAVLWISAALIVKSKKAESREK